MSFQIPLTGVIALPQTVPAQALGGVERLRQILPVGTILDLLITADPQGNPRLNLAGQFFSAALPSNVKAGERITVEVLEHNEMLLLKLLEQGAPAIQNKTRDLESKLFQAIVKAVLPELSTQDLITTPPALEHLPPHFVKLAEPRTDLALPKTSSVDTPLAQRLETVLRQLIDDNFILSDRAFENPGRIESAIKHAALPVPERLREVIRGELKSAAQAAEQQPRLRFLKVLDEYLRTAIETPPGAVADAETHSIPGTVNPPAVGKLAIPTQSVKDVQLYAEASLMALETSDTGALRALTAALRKPEAPEHPIMILIRTLSAFLPEQPELLGAPVEKSFSELVRAVVAELKQLHDLRSAEKDPKEPLQKAKLLIANLRVQYAGSDPETEAKAELHATLKHMEQLHGAKEALAQLNPLMHSIGQPQYHLIPAMQQGNFGAWEVLASKIRVDAEEEQRNKKEHHGTDQVCVRLPLPAMGQVQLELRNHGGELYINIGLADPLAADFVAQRLPQLQAKLEQTGFVPKHLGARAMESEPLLPQWYRELVKHAVIA